MADGLKRRDFLKVFGAGSATVATVGCSTGEVERLIPYVVPAEEITPGVPTYYTSTCRECPAGCGIVVETHEGRVTKVEGNPANPISHGNLCARGQASVQGLYHPDRLQGPTLKEGELTTWLPWGTLEQQLAERLGAARGRPGGIVFLTHDYTGTMARLADAFTASVGGRRVVYDTLADAPRDLNFADADLLVSFGADFLETWGSPVDYAWQFTQFRTVRGGRRGKFVWVGPHRPLTGLSADQWIAPRPGTEALIALALAGRVDATTAARQTGVDERVLQDLMREFRAGRGVALGPGPAISGRNTAQLRAALAELNGGGGAAAAQTTSRLVDVAQLIEQMHAGQVAVLLIDAPNPAYTLPGPLAARFAQALQRVGTSVSFSPFPDETSLLCTMALPDHHFLEKWDDYVPRPGLLELVQPAMRPVFNTKHIGDVLLSVARQVGGGTAPAGLEAATYYDYLRAGWLAQAGDEAGWRQAVQRGGLYPGDAAAIPPTIEARELESGFSPSAAPAAPAVAAAGAAPTPGLQPIEFEGGEGATLHLVVYPSYRFYDGRTANRPWLLELPDPVTKVPWMSWVEMHPATAAELGLEQGDTVELRSPYGALETYVYVYPGVRPDTVAIQMGLGHKAFGRYTEGRGVNPNLLLGPAADAADGAAAPYGLRVAVRRTGGGDRYSFIPSRAPEGLFEQGVRVQHDREIAQAISLAALVRQDAAGAGLIPGQDETLEVLKGDGGFTPVPTPTDPAAYPPPGTDYGEYVQTERRWAMVIDLARCIGCSACVIACNAENNVPVVGPEEMKKGRELHWLRIERYWGVTRDETEAYREGATDDTRFLPMLCQHCGNAPCEPVCPVYAAYHTPDGLNGQIYNRCVGTRYCANNCPYKVRVFNWFTYDFVEPLNWQLNPDVTVREKGVMEKCTFCVQRIREGERQANVERRPLRAGEIVPACVQTCPTEVFVFGDITDANSPVARAARSPRSYRVLGALNVQPAVVYLKKVTLAEPAQGGHHAPAGAGFDPGTQETH